MENKSDHPAAPPATEICGECGHEKRLHVYVGGTNTNCKWGYCDCPGYRPTSSEAKTEYAHVQSDEWYDKATSFGRLEPKFPVTPPADRLMEAARAWLKTHGCGCTFTCACAEMLDAFAAERVSAAIESYIAEVEIQMAYAPAFDDCPAGFVQAVSEAMRSVAER